MGKVKSFKFEFTGNRAVFYPGQWVSGDCKLVTNDSLKVKSFGICLVGEAGYRSKKGGTIEKKEFVTPVQEQTIYGPSTISAGDHTHQFRFQIPPEVLPTSFEGDFGFIRYYLQGTIKRPWKADISTRKVFTVWEYVDCNNPLLSAPQIGQSEKLIEGGCFSASKRNYITLQLDRRGYCPGEHIIVSVKVVDFPAGIILKMMLTMVSLFSESANKQGLSKREVLQECPIGTVPRGSKSHRFANVSLQIPSVPPTIRFRGASGLGISVYYLLEVTMLKKSGSKSKLYWHVNLPVTMGTIPLTAANAAARSHPPLTATLSTPNNNATEEPPAYMDVNPSAPPPPDSFPECPPSYEECILGSSNLDSDAPCSTPTAPAENDYGDHSYTPVYTMARGARIDYSFADDS